MVDIGVGTVVGDVGEVIVITEEGAMGITVGAAIMSTGVILGIEVAVGGVGRRERLVRSLWRTGCSEDCCTMGRLSIRGHGAGWDLHGR